MFILLYYCFNVHEIYTDILSFISDISYLCPLSFHYLLWLEAYQFYWCFQRTSFWFYWFYWLLYFPFSIPLITIPILIISFFLLTLELICSSFNDFRFFYICIKNSPLNTALIESHKYWQIKFHFYLYQNIFKVSRSLLWFKYYLKVCCITAKFFPESLYYQFLL